MQTSTIRSLSYHLVDKLDCGFKGNGLNSQLREMMFLFFFFLFRETKELEMCRNAAIQAQTGTPIWLDEAGLDENRKIVLVLQCFRNHCTDTICWWCIVKSLSINSVHFSCQYLFESIDIFGIFVI